MSYLFIDAFECMAYEPIDTSTVYTKVDIFLLTDPLCGLGSRITRFDPAVYPVAPGMMTDNIDSFNKLTDNLMSESQKHGNCSLNVHAKYGSNVNRASVYCSRATKYRESKKLKAQGEFRKHSLNQDRKNARSNDGKSQKKKTATSKPTDNESTCKAKLVVGMDSFSFFLVCGKGSSCHEGHPPKTIEEMPSRKRLLLEEAKDEAKLLANHGARPGLISAVMGKKHGIEVTQRQALSLTQMSKLASTMISAENLKKYKLCMSDQD
jgi:hypothetical protein